MFTIKFVLCIFAILVLCSLFSWQNFHVNGRKLDYPALYVYGCCIFASAYIFPVIACLSSFTGVSSFCKDYVNGYIKYVIIRGNADDYAWAKIYANSISAFITAFLGLTFFCIYLEVILENKDLGNATVSGILFNWSSYGNRAWLYYLVHNLLISTATALWAAVALTISSFIPDFLVTLSIPIVANYILERMSLLYLPDFLNLFVMVNGVEMENVRFPFNILYSIGIFMTLTFSCGFVFRYCIERRKLRGTI